MGNLSPGLAGPVAFELAEPVEQIPGEHAMSGGSRYEMKWDGFRAGAVCRDGQVRLWSRNGKDFTAKFPEIQAALARQVDVDCVLDGELIVMVGGRSSFDALQLRNSSRAEVVRRELVPKAPALFMVFDLLAVGDVDIRVMRWTKRRARLEDLAVGWRAPLQLPPAFEDLDRAMELLEVAEPTGVEGLVIKGATTRYVPGKRGWAKWKIRDTTEAVLGAVTGTLDYPETLIVGRYRGKVLEVVGRTTRLKPAQAAVIAGLLKPAGAQHPWPDQLSTHWGQGKTEITRVRPDIVVEVAADTAMQAGRFRHPLRFLRTRLDLSPDDVEAISAPES